MWRKGTLLHCWWECRLLQPLWRAVWRYLKKLKISSAFWPSDRTSGNITEGPQNTNSKEYKHPYVYCSAIYNHQDTIAAQVSISRRVGKTTMGHLNDGILLSHNKRRKFYLCDSMDGPREHCAKWNKLVRERIIPFDFTHIWNLMNKLN